jgi:hypothetical protein
MLVSQLQTFVLSAAFTASGSQLPCGAAAGHPKDFRPGHA